MEDHGFVPLERGRICSGVVSRVEPFGVFIQLDDGPEGFIAVPELAWRRLRRIEDVVRLGGRVRVVVLGADLQLRRTYLSLRATEPDPFPGLVALVGKVVAGEVTKVAPVGVFVRIEDRRDGFEGLLPGAQAGQRALPDPRLLREADQVSVLVVSVDLDGRKVLLGPAPQ